MIVTQYAHIVRLCMGEVNSCVCTQIRAPDGTPEQYIVTQGPLSGEEALKKSTIEAFWNMVFTHSARVIAMLTCKLRCNYLLYGISYAQLVNVNLVFYEFNCFHDHITLKMMLYELSIFSSGWSHVCTVLAHQRGRD